MVAVLDSGWSRRTPKLYLGYTDQGCPVLSAAFLGVSDSFSAEVQYMAGEVAEGSPKPASSQLVARREKPEICLLP